MPEAMQRQGEHGIDMRAVMWTGVAIIVTLVLAGVAAYAAWSAWKGSQANDAPNTEPDFHIAGPMLESAPRAERDSFMRDKERLLHSYGWVDPAAGIARIPIDDAMEILAERKQQRQEGRQEVRR